MKLSQSGIGKMRVNNLDEMYPAQDMLLQSGQLVIISKGNCLSVPLEIASQSPLNGHLEQYSWTSPSGHLFVCKAFAKVLALAIAIFESVPFGSTPKVLYQPEFTSIAMMYPLIVFLL